MKMATALEIINKPEGFMVSLEWHQGNILRSDYFPDKHAGEPLIETEEEAWRLASKFAKKTEGDAVNVYVINADFTPVAGYEANKLNRLRGE